MAIVFFFMYGQNDYSLPDGKQILRVLVSVVIAKADNATFKLITALWRPLDMVLQHWASGLALTIATKYDRMNAVNFGWSSERG